MPQTQADACANRGSSSRARAFRSVGAALGEESAGVIANQFNKGTRQALNEERDLRKGFYNATQVVDLLMEKGNGWSEVLSIKNRRNDLINFLTDGYLPTEATDKFTGREYSQMRMKAYENQLNIATYGVRIINLLKAEGVKLQQNTKNSIYELLEKYKSEGGKKDFSELNKMIK